MWRKKSKKNVEILNRNVGICKIILEEIELNIQNLPRKIDKTLPLWGKGSSILDVLTKVTNIMKKIDGDIGNEKDNVKLEDLDIHDIEEIYRFCIDKREKKTGNLN